jgi:hypothetical protein
MNQEFLIAHWSVLVSVKGAKCSIGDLILGNYSDNLLVMHYE